MLSASRSSLSVDCKRHRIVRQSSAAGDEAGNDAEQTAGSADGEHLEDQEDDANSDRVDVDMISDDDDDDQDGTASVTSVSITSRTGSCNINNNDINDNQGGSGGVAGRNGTITTTAAAAVSTSVDAGGGIDYGSRETVVSTTQRGSAGEGGRTVKATGQARRVAGGGGSSSKLSLRKMAR